MVVGGCPKPCKKGGQIVQGNCPGGTCPGEYDQGEMSGSHVNGSTEMHHFWLSRSIAQRNVCVNGRYARCKCGCV